MRFASIGSRGASRPAPSTETGAGAEGAAGFTLLETLTAMTILAIALVSLFEAHAGGLRAAGAATDSARARLLAEALMAETASKRPGTPLSRQGSDGRFSWSVDVRPEDAPWAATASEKNWRMQHIRVAVAWDKNRRIELDTLRLGTADE